MIKRLIGVNIAVKDLDAAVKRYEDVLGIKPQFLKPEDFALPGIKGAFFRVGDGLINLLTSEQPETSIAKFLETRGEGLFLIELEVTDAEQATKELLEKGVKLVSDKPLPFEGGKVNFSHPKSMHGVMMAFAQLWSGAAGLPEGDDG